MSFVNGLAQSNIGQGMNSLAGKLSAPPAQAPYQQLQTDYGANSGALAQDNADIAAGGDLSGQTLQVNPSTLLSVMPGLPNLSGQGASGGAIPTGSPVSAMQNGGVVRLNNGSPQINPQFQRGPALPVGPNATAVPSFTQAPQALAAGGVVSAPALPAGPQSGIVPASTEGQVLTMDGGGAVPAEMGSQPFYSPMGGPAPQVSGGAAGLASGMAQGQVMGENLLNAWHQHQAREDLANSSASAESASGIPGQQAAPSQPVGGLVGDVVNPIDHFFHHLHGALLGDNHTPNAAGGQPGVYPTQGTANPIPGQTNTMVPAPTQGAPSPVPAGAAPAGAPAAVKPPVAGSPSGTPGAPPAQAPNTQTQATASAVQAAAPQAQQDIQQMHSGQDLNGPAQQAGAPHSLTPEWWEHNEALKIKAMRSAAMNGQNPLAVGQSLDAIRTSAIQGQVMRWGSVANQAIQDGDDTSLKQALRNMNYYLPNGQDLQFKTASAADAKADPSLHVGQMMFKNPYYGMPDSPTGNSEYIGANAQYIQQTMMNAMDPANVQSSILSSYSAIAKARAEQVTATGMQQRGEGIFLSGRAANTRADDEAAGVGFKNYLLRAQGNNQQAQANLAQARAAAGGFATRGNPNAPKVTFPAVQAAQKAATDAVNQALLGPQIQIPQGPNGPAQLVHDQTKVDPVFQGLSSQQQNEARGVAQRLAGANMPLGYGANTIADAAARITRWQHSGSTHPVLDGKGKPVIDPATKKPKMDPDVQYDAKNDTVHVWTGGTYRNFFLTPNVIDPAIGGGDQGGAGIPAGGSGGGGSGGDQTAALDQEGASMDSGQ